MPLLLGGSLPLDYFRSNPGLFQSTRSIQDPDINSVKVTLSGGVRPMSSPAELII